MAHTDTTPGRPDVTYEQLGNDRREIPESWARLGEARSLDEAGDWYYAIEICIERHERHERESPLEVDVSERTDIFVRYSTADGEQAMQGRYAGAVIEQADGVVVVPKVSREGVVGSFWSRIQCAAPDDYDMAAPSKPDDAERVRSIYDLDADTEQP